GLQLLRAEMTARSTFALQDQRDLPVRSTSDLRPFADDEAASVGSRADDDVSGRPPHEQIGNRQQSHAGDEKEGCVGDREGRAEGGAGQSERGTKEAISDAPPPPPMR